MTDPLEPIVVDSAIYIQYLRDGIDIRLVLMPWLANGALYNCGVIRSEVIRGFRNGRLKAEMTAFFDIVPEVPTTSKFWRIVAEMAWSIDRMIGGNRPLTDMIIARCAMDVGAVLVSPDKHFLDIPGLKLRETLQ